MSVIPTGDVRFRVFERLLDAQMHNTSANFPLRVLIVFSGAYGRFIIENHQPLPINIRLKALAC